MNFLKISIISLLTLALFSSCEMRKNGELSITYLNESNQAVSGADIYIYDSQDNYDRAYYLETFRTNSQGKANFPGLVPGNYYFDVTHRRPGGLLQTLKGNAMVFPDQVTEATLKP